MTRQRLFSQLVAVAVLVLAVAALSGGAASAGVTPTTDCTSNDPYGCLATTTTTTSNQACTVSGPSAQVGSRVDATVTNAPAGATINLLLNGSVVDSETTAASPAFATVQFSFVVPALPEGKYPLEAVGPAFRVTCLAAEGGLQVLGAGASRGGVGSTDGDGSSLARTGFTVVGLLAAAAVLLVVGRVALERSRRTASLISVGNRVRADRRR